MTKPPTRIAFLGTGQKLPYDGKHFSDESPKVAFQHLVCTSNPKATIRQKYKNKTMSELRIESDAVYFK